MENFDISVIIPTYNRNKLLEISLQSLLKQKLNNTTFEVIVVDDGSSEETISIVKAFETSLNIKYYYQSDNGFKVSEARNAGANISGGKYLVFIDAGIAVCSTFVSEYHRILVNNENSFVVGYVAGFDDHDKYKQAIIDNFNAADVDGTIQVLLNFNAYDRRESVYQSMGDDLSKWPAPWVIGWSCNIGISKDAYQRIGGFDEAYTTYGGEDADFAINAFVHHIRFILDRSAIAVHYPHEKNKNTVSTEEAKKYTLRKRKYMFNKYGLSSIRTWIGTKTELLNGELSKAGGNNEN